MLHRLLLYSSVYGIAVAQPYLQFSGHFGGGWNTNSRLAVDATDHAYFALTTERIDLPVSPDAPQGAMPEASSCRSEFLQRCPQGFIAKVSPSGKIVGSTYLGGTRGARIQAIATDSTGQVWVAGTTSSSDFPNVTSLKGIPTGAISAGIFLAQLTPDLSRVAFATRLPFAPFFDNLSLAIDPSGFVHIAGSTNSTMLPVQNAFQATRGGAVDGFLLKFDPDTLRLVYLTYFGGSGVENIEDLSIDSEGAAVVVGHTNSVDFPTQKALQAVPGGSTDGFIAKFSRDGKSLLWSTYLGGSEDDWLLAVAVDFQGEVHAAGFSDSVNFPLVNAGVHMPNGIDRFAALVRISGDGQSIQLSTLYPKVNGFQSLAVERDGKIWVAGQTLFGGGVLSGMALQNQQGNAFDAFVAQLSKSGELLWSTYLGGSRNEEVTSLAFSPSGAILISGLTESEDFPLAHPALPSQIGSSRPDAFLARFGGSLPAPTFEESGIANAAGFQTVTTVAGAAPGTLLSLFGEDLAPRLLSAGSLPLPTQLADTAVLVNGAPAPLRYVSPRQINFQLPSGLAGGSASIQIRRGDVLSAERRIALTSASPGIFIVDRFLNLAAAVWASTGQLASCSEPTASDDYLAIYATGLGDVMLAGSWPRVRLGDRDLHVSWVGPAPDSSGVYQINASVPADLVRPQAVVYLPLIVSIDDAASNPAKVCLRR